MVAIVLPPAVLASKEKLICSAIGFWLLVVLPYIHLGILYKPWNVEKEPVDKKSCTCDCWDTNFKGTYQAKLAGYKHVYFNTTSETLKIWTSTVLAVLALYECTCRLVALFLKREMRWTMLALFLSVVYSHYYAWWSIFNYYNDEFYKQWNHQLFFTITELVSTVSVLYLCNAKNQCSPETLLVIVSMAVLHILASGWDQFVSNIILKQGQWHQIPRDLGFMAGDLLHILIPLWELLTFARQNKISVRECLPVQYYAYAASSVWTLLMVSRFL